MNDTQQPILNNKQLLKSVLIALVVGVIVVLGAVLPAEYNKDPLGTGKLFGFSKLHMDDTAAVEGETQNLSTTNFEIIKLQKLGSPPSISKPIEAENSLPVKQLSTRADTIQVLVPAGKGIEYKFKSLKMGSVKYDWYTSDSNVVYIDFHGEVYEENPQKEVFYESYTVAYSTNMAGTFTAPFKGKHGWYFRNKNDADVTVTLHLQGQYALLEEYSLGN